MTDDVRQYWQAYVDSIKGTMRLADWVITIVEKIAGDEDRENLEDIGASIAALEKRHEAQMSLGVNWETFTPTTQRQYIAHELIHLHLWRLMSYADSLAMNLGTEARMMAINQVSTETEYCVDDMAMLIAPFLPLPDIEYDDLSSADTA